MENETKIAAQLRSLGEYVVAERQVLMRAWRQSVRNDPELKTARNLSHSRFDDYIPALLQAFAQQLAAWPGEGIAAAAHEQEKRGAKHGAHRWQEGYALPEVAREWLHLQLVLFDLFEQHAENERLEARTMVVARRILTLLCGNGVSRSVTEYTRLMQAEAADRVRDLETALAALNDLQRQRADVWREAAHDLRNSVGVVTNATGLLRRDDAPEPVRAKSLAALQTGVGSLKAMLNDLLDLARLEAGIEQREIAPLDAAAVLRDVCAQMQSFATARNLCLRADGPAQLPVQGDEEKLRRIACNLVASAVRSTAQGEVSVRWAPVEDGELRHWVLSIEDSSAQPGGSGAAAVVDELTRIEGDAERKADAGRGGSRSRQHAHGEGVASSIVKHLSELLDATLELSSSAGTSRVRVIFPCRYDDR